MKKLSLFFMIAAVAAVLASCGDGYGTKLNYGSTELYYTDKVTETEAKALGDYLEETKFTDGDETKTVQITKEGDVYQFRMVVKESYLDDEDYESVAAFYAYSLSLDVFDGEEVEVHFCDDKLETKKVVEMDKGSDDIEYEMLEFDATEVQYDKSVTKAEVNALGEYLIEGGFTDGTTKSVQFVKEYDTYVFRMVVSEESASDVEYQEIARSFANSMSTDILNGEAVEIQLCDEYFLPYEYIGMNY